MKPADELLSGELPEFADQLGVAPGRKAGVEFAGAPPQPVAGRCGDQRVGVLERFA